MNQKNKFEQKQDGKTSIHDKQTLTFQREEVDFNRKSEQ